tara:strand:- start:463 stop:816 length:354 start_codon:yes stop_codon:yes gene_type:complete
MESEFKMVCTAAKGSYGTGFEDVFDNIEDLKRAIVKQELNPWDQEDNTYTEDDYTDELFKEICKTRQYTVVIVKLHSSEKISFNEYDGTSSPYIEKIDPQFKSTMEYVTDKHWKLLE